MPGIATSFAFDGSPLSSATEPDARASYAVLELDGHRVRAITRHPWKLIWDQKSGEKKLFNLELDEREIWDLTERHLIAQLRCSRSSPR